jgi:hypothetical protein
MTPKKSSKLKSPKDKKSPKPSSNEILNSPNSTKSTKKHFLKKSSKNSPKSWLKPSTKNSKLKKNYNNKNQKTTNTKPGTFFLTQIRINQIPRAVSQTQTRRLSFQVIHLQSRNYTKGKFHLRTRKVAQRSWRGVRSCQVEKISTGKQVPANEGGTRKNDWH